MFHFSVDIMKLLYSCPPGYTIILVSGDLDFNPVVQQILNNQIEVELWSFRKGRTNKRITYNNYFIF